MTNFSHTVCRQPPAPRSPVSGIKNSFLSSVLLFTLLRKSKRPPSLTAQLCRPTRLPSVCLVIILQPPSLLGVGSFSFPAYLGLYMWGYMRSWTEVRNCIQRQWWCGDVGYTASVLKSKGGIIDINTWRDAFWGTQEWGLFRGFVFVAFCCLHLHRLIRTNLCLHEMVLSYLFDTHSHKETPLVFSHSE